MSAPDMKEIFEFFRKMDAKVGELMIQHTRFERRLKALEQVNKEQTENKGE